MNTKAVTIIGCKVSEDDLKKAEKYRVCQKSRKKEGGLAVIETDLTQCQLEESGIQYDDYGTDFLVCPFCVSPPYQPAEKLAYDEDYKIRAEIDGEIAEADVVRSRSDETAEWFVGFVQGQAQTSITIRSITDETMSRYRARLRAILEPKRLWREHAFGIHTLLIVE